LKETIFERKMHDDDDDDDDGMGILAGRNAWQNSFKK